MTAKQINKHGLKRYIPAPIREKIRKDSGYGCVICGSLFGDYEHIEPEYHDAHEHNPECMTFLCVEHHSAVTRNRLSKKQYGKQSKTLKQNLKVMYLTLYILTTLNQK